MRHLSTDTPMPRRHRAAAVLALTGATAALLPAAALAATPVSRTYHVGVKAMALAKGHTVTARVTVTDPETKVAGWWSFATVAKVVRKGIDGGYQSPYHAQGFACTPVVHDEWTSFTCRLRGADVPTRVTLRFSVIYRGDTRSG